MDYDKKKNELRHVAFIMDGNRRWAKKNGLPVIDGHKMGSQVIKKIVKKSLKLKIRYLTFYSFSTENWNRDPLEVNDLQNLLKFYLDSEVENFIKNKIKFKVIGDITNFSKPIISRLYKIIDLTKNFNELHFILALSYGSRNEIINGINNIIKARKKHINEEVFNNFLMTKDIPDPDLVIRTSGEMRISNFLLWQIAYSELYFTKTLWPEFNSSKYQKAINNFIKRKRRFGTDPKLR